MLKILAFYQELLEVGFKALNDYGKLLSSKKFQFTPKQTQLLEKHFAAGFDVVLFFLHEYSKLFQYNLALKMELYSFLKPHTQIEESLYRLGQIELEQQFHESAKPFLTNQTDLAKKVNVSTIAGRSLQFGKPSVQENILTPKIPFLFALLCEHYPKQDNVYASLIQMNSEMHWIKYWERFVSGQF